VDKRSQLIECLLSHLNENYIFPAVANEVEQAIRMRLSSGEYDAISSGETFAETLTEHMQAVSHDKHLRVFYRSDPLPQGDDAERQERRQAEFHQWAELHNHGFQKVERLPGNIGYLDFHMFMDPAFGAAETAVAAMNFVANTDALLIDLRRNGGGHPAMVALITSYLFDEMVHLNSFYWRESDNTQQFWTLPYVPGKRYGTQKPVYVLTSSHTFSGAEEFCYNLKHLKRATLVGEVTGGGAHPGDIFQLDDHLEVFIPTGRPINPISGTNWEGTGVIPDVQVPADKALDEAKRLALKQIIARLDGPLAWPQRELLEEAKTALAELEE